MLATRSVDYSVLVITRHSVDQMLWIKKQWQSVSVVMFIIVTAECIIGREGGRTGRGGQGGSLNRQLSVEQSGLN